jgi:hypothetical protein
MKLHQAALAKDLASDRDIDELIESLHRLADDPPAEIHRQFSEAVEPGRAPRSFAAPSTRRHQPPTTLEAYKGWFKTASVAQHVAAVSAHFLDCWNAALNSQRGADEAG